uniref:Uncharacterized protein n=1 Tax=Avena sativa TaxID=4498 RepID=A0ACD5TRB7_AVESA
MSSAGGGGYESGQSNEIGGGGAGYESGQSTHAGGGEDYSGEADADEEDGGMQNMMEEEDYMDGESGDSDDPDDSDGEGNGGEDMPIPASWNQNISTGMTVDDCHDSAWEYHSNRIAQGARYQDKQHLQDAVVAWAMLSRKGSSKTATGWLHRVGVYGQEWDTATARVWDSNDAFDMEEFNRYLDSYMSATRLRITQQSHPEEMPGAATWDSYPSQSTVGSRQHAAQLLVDLETESAEYRRSLSSGPLLIHRQDQETWLSRLEEKIRRIYGVITCTRSSDIAHHPAPQRPPRHSTHHQQQQPPSPLRQAPRPRLTPQTTPRPPPPDQAGGSTWHQQSSFDCWQQQQPPLHDGGSPWQHQQQEPPLHDGGSSWQHQQQEPWGHSPMPNYGFRPQPQPQGAFGMQGSMPGYQSSVSGSAWTDQVVDHSTRVFMTQSSWLNIFQTPAPDPTQETQYDEHGSVIPPRQVRPPHRFGWTTPPNPPPERRGRRRR